MADSSCVCDIVVVRRDLPSGTVTFLFTDVEGSTKLLHELGAERYAEALAEHRRVLREAFSAHGGIEVDTQGDAFFVAFPTAPGALSAAVQAIKGLAPSRIRVRMGLHSGTPHLTEEGYVGADVHRAARIAACGHGGQLLISAATASLLGPDGLRDLGEHRLKDLSAPERIYQLGDVDFPPLKSLHQTNLPVPSTPFLGRERELVQVLDLLSGEGIRLLTLTGPGGTGKTRLALQAAGGLADRYPEGVWWVPLAPLRDPELVRPTAAEALGAKDGLSEHIGDNSTLVLFDNFEQVVEAAAVVAGLLASCPNLDVLVTSREPLHVTGEHEYPVPPLEHEEGVGLFVARARAVKLDFETDEAVSEICRRLDDLPLALELAAARVKALSPRQILERLEQRLPLLTGGARDLPERQRTLRATIEWSHELLNPDEQRLFARLAVFADGCTLEAAEDVAETDVDALQSLIDKSLLRSSGERYRMLETIREYAAERLAGSGEEDAIRDRHLEHFRDLCERAYEERFTSEMEWLPILETEHDNIRGALDWARATQPRAEAQLAGAIADHWMVRGHAREALERLTGALRRYTARDPIRARALTLRGELEDDLETLEEGVNLWRELGDARGEGLALEALGWAHDHYGNYAAAQEAYEQSLAIRERAGVPDFEGVSARAGLCHVLVASGKVEPAEEMAQEFLAVAATSQKSIMRELALHFLADCPLVAGDYAESERRYLRALAYARSAGLPGRAADEVLGVAMSLAGQGESARAVRLAAAAHAEQERLGNESDRWWRTMQDRLLGGARTRLTPDDLEEADRIGRETPFDIVLDEVLGTNSGS
jgi:predicted ATPase/class 3 adenylate cyclase